MAERATYRGADKSFARLGRKQARKHVRDARDFNNIETRAVIKFPPPPARQGAEGNSRHSDRNISLISFLVGIRTYQHPCKNRNSHSVFVMYLPFHLTFCNELGWAQGVWMEIFLTTWSQSELPTSGEINFSLTSSRPVCSFRGTNQGRIPWICLNDRRMHPDVQHHSTSSEGSLAPPSPPLHKSCIRMKTSKKWWNDTDRGTNEAPIPVPRFPQHILTLRGLDRTQASAMRDRRHGLRHDTASIQHDGYESPR